MPSGLQIFDGSGRAILDTNFRMGRVLGILVNPSTNGGSINVPGFATGTPFWQIVANQSNPNAIPIFPTVTVSGNTLTWSYASPGSTGSISGAGAPVNIFYGVF